MSDKLRAAAQAVLKSTKSFSVYCENFNHRKQDFHDDGKCPPWRRYNDALTALEAALAEPAIKESLTVAEQEPVAFVNLESLTAISYNPDTIGASRYKTQFRNYPLYAAPPRREWIGLKDEDFEKEKFVDYNFMSGASFAAAKLREKNGG